MTAMEHVVVVGASLAGMRAAETLRAEGFSGTLTVVGDEAHAPYDRPPLSKQVLAGEWDVERIVLPSGARAELGLTWERGVAATGLDLTARELVLADGRTLPFDGRPGDRHRSHGPVDPRHPWPSWRVHAADAR